MAAGGSDEGGGAPMSGTSRRVAVAYSGNMERKRGWALVGSDDGESGVSALRFFGRGALLSLSLAQDILRFAWERKGGRREEGGG